jgi:hypothetical protein
MFAPKDQDNGRAGARGLTRRHHRALTRGLRRAAAGAVCAAAVTLPVFGAAAAQATTTTPPFTTLTLVNGWANYGNGSANAAVANIHGIVHLKGGIKTSGTNPVPFTLPAGDRPAHDVYVPADLCFGDNGRLAITPTGSVTVEAEGGTWSNAQCFTSLDGVSFAPSASSFTKLALQNGWTSTGLDSDPPAVRVISGIVHLEGDMYSNGINPVPFTLPARFRPAHNVAIKVALCGEDSGDLVIGPGGQATVRAGGGNWANAQCQTSLDGVWFAR